jgi:CubicO group peptidase (beta-lactamase class C family)
VEKTDPNSGKTELNLQAPQRAFTVQDLLRHTSGLTYGVFGNSEVDQLNRKANLFDPNQTLAELVTKL